MQQHAYALQTESTAYAPAPGVAYPRRGETYDYAYSSPAPRGIPRPIEREFAKPSEELQERLRQREQSRRLGRQSVSILSVLGFLLVSISAILMLLANANLTVANTELVRLEAELNTLEREAGILQLEHERAFVTMDIESYARDTLGMITPGDRQIVYIGIQSGDMVEVIRPDAPPETGFFHWLLGLVGLSG